MSLLLGVPRYGAELMGRLLPPRTAKEQEFGSLCTSLQETLLTKDLSTPLSQLNSATSKLGQSRSDNPVTVLPFSRTGRTSLC